MDPRVKPAGDAGEFCDAVGLERLEAELLRRRCSLSPLAGGEGRGEGASPQAQARGETPSPSLASLGRPLHSPSQTGVNALTASGER